MLLHVLKVLWYFYSIDSNSPQQAFHDIAYHAEERKDLMDAINEFLDYSIVLPPGNLDKETLLPIMEMARRKTEKQQKLKGIDKKQNKTNQN